MRVTLDSDDANAGLDEGDVVRVAHAYRVVAGDTVGRLVECSVTVACDDVSHASVCRSPLCA